jgi:hypothetical protein
MMAIYGKLSWFERIAINSRYLLPMDVFQQELFYYKITRILSGFWNHLENEWAQQHSTIKMI